ncbi:putative ribonuclease H protein [Senna tora]|uniref:Putative ribonuclease H protein n=1 Tax=Senna tora TaxID=362788 RepID=A0A835CJR6_9FABA|nr:putative ribonuclease H protein [Senna tora]
MKIWLTREFSAVRIRQPCLAKRASFSLVIFLNPNPPSFFFVHKRFQEIIVGDFVSSHCPQKNFLIVASHLLASEWFSLPTRQFLLHVIQDKTSIPSSCILSIDESSKDVVDYFTGTFSRSKEHEHIICVKQMADGRGGSGNLYPLNAFITLCFDKELLPMWRKFHVIENLLEEGPRNLVIRLVQVWFVLLRRCPLVRKDPTILVTSPWIVSQQCWKNKGLIPSGPGALCPLIWNRAVLISILVNGLERCSSFS